MMNDVNWKESFYLLPTPVFTEKIGKKPTQIVRVIFERVPPKYETAALYTFKIV